jgi:hypothetical protein
VSAVASARAGGLWSVGGDYSSEQNRTYFKLDVSGYTIDMELARVSIDRPWMDSAALKSRAWKWLDSSPYFGQVISDGGDAASGVTPKGVMPFMPTGVLLARNVTLAGTWSADLKTTYDSHTTAGGSVGWGPFSFGGRTDLRESTSYVKANAAGNTISFSSPQILGFFVEVLPKSPDPDPRYKFPSGSLNTYMDLLAKVRGAESDELLRRAKASSEQLRKERTQKMEEKKN